MRTRTNKLARAMTPSLLSALLIAMSLPVAAGDTFRPVVRGRRGVVAGGHPLSVEAGMRILQRGGNAVDAGVATILAASVIEFSHFSFGGEVPILVKLKTKPVAVVEGMGTAPRKATREFFVSHARDDANREADSAPDGARAQGGDSSTTRSTRKAEDEKGSPNNPPPTQVVHIPSTGPTAATVPAVLDACVTALDQFGTKTLAEVMQPAIELADGFPIDELRVEYIRRLAPVFSKWADAKRVFLPGGEVPKVGDVFVQADLARTMRSIVEAEKRAGRGGRHFGLMAARNYFYKGEVGRRIGDYMQRNGGLLSAEDIASFRARVGEPARGTYRGYEVYKAGFWTQGPAFIETLNILEGYDLKAIGHNSPEYVHALVEALKLGFADRDRYFGDPDFVKIPTAQLLSKDYAALRRKLINDDRASLDYTPGDPISMKPLLAGVEPMPARESRVSPLERANDTTCVNVIDKDGNLFSATPSGAWLPAVVAGDTGVLMAASTVRHARPEQPERRRAGEASAHHAHADARLEKW
jgi:gamma-glutamyltranspeptidase/glutathione hydrolase